MSKTETIPVKDEKKHEKVLITGDDILIEYVERLIGSIKGLPASYIQATWNTKLEKFISHYVWHQKSDEDDSEPLWSRLEGRLYEM